MQDSCFRDETICIFGGQKRKYAVRIENLINRSLKIYIGAKNCKMWHFFKKFKKNKKLHFQLYKPKKNLYEIKIFYSSLLLIFSSKNRKNLYQLKIFNLSLKNRFLNKKNCKVGTYMVLFTRNWTKFAFLVVQVEKKFCTSGKFSIHLPSYYADFIWKQFSTLRF